MQTLLNWSNLFSNQNIGTRHATLLVNDDENLGNYEVKFSIYTSNKAREHLSYMTAPLRTAARALNILETYP